jgi:integrase/recombinase XerD
VMLIEYRSGLISLLSLLTRPPAPRLQRAQIARQGRSWQAVAVHRTIELKVSPTAGWVTAFAPEQVSRRGGLLVSLSQGGTAMTTIDTPTAAIGVAGDDFAIDDAQLAAVAFLARYSGRTLDAYRQDLRGFFQWAADNMLSVLAAARPHIELYRSWMKDRGLAASTIDRRLSTVCGFYRFAHIDGRITSNPAQYVRRPWVHPSNGRGLERSELGVFLFTAEQYDRDHAALAVVLGVNGLRVSEACASNIEDLGIERGHRTLRILGKGNKPATIPLVPPTARTIDLAIGERSEGAILRRDGERLDRAGWPRSRAPPHAPSRLHHGGPWRRRAPYATCSSRPATQTPRTTTIYDRRRQNFDCHATYVVVA